MPDTARHLAHEPIRDWNTLDLRRAVPFGVDPWHEPGGCPLRWWGRRALCALMADSVFTTPRSAVRRWCRADIDDLFTACTDAEAMRWVGDGRPSTRPERGQWLDRMLTNHDRRGYGMIALQLRDHGDGRRTRCFEWSAAP